MKLTKTKFRARMTSENLADRLTVCLLTSGVPNYNPSAAVEFWYQSAERRPREKKEDCEEDSDDEIDNGGADDEQLYHDNLESDVAKPEIDMFLQNLDTHLKEIDELV